MRNGPRTSHLADLLVNSDVLVWREEKGWQGLYQLLAVNRETVQIQLPNRPRSFRSTSIKLFYEDPKQVDAQRGNLLGVSILVLEELELGPEKRPVVEIPPFVPDLGEVIYKDLDVELEAFLTEKETRDR